MKWCLLTLVVFVVSLIWVYSAGRLWVKGQLRSYKEDTNQTMEEIGNGEKEQE